jgi:XTP/dITP diphosphohydrolase
LRALSTLPPSVSRKARFRCVLVLARAGKMIATFEGVVEGGIARQEMGTGGFGYDPIFLPKELSRTFAQLSATQKNSISHRGIAVARLRAFLEAYPLAG